MTTLDTPAVASRPIRSRTRLWILGLILFLATVAYADRSILSISAPGIKSEFGLSQLQLGYVLSAFSWAYVIGQIPGGLLLDRFGTKIVYGVALALWSIATFLIGLVGAATKETVVALSLLFALRFVVGFVEGPSFPANARASVMWFPEAERRHCLPRPAISPSASFRPYPAGSSRNLAGPHRSSRSEAWVLSRRSSGGRPCRSRATTRAFHRTNSIT